jgi:hypothetical protein
MKVRPNRQRPDHQREHQADFFNTIGPCQPFIKRTEAAARLHETGHFLHLHHRRQATGRAAEEVAIQVF